MSTVRVLARNGVRRRVAALGGLGLLVALGVGTAMASLAVAWRTQHAYPGYLRRVRAGELVLNPGLPTDRIRDILATTPGVLDVVSDSVFAATPDEGAPRPRRDVEGSMAQVRSSTDGRYRVRERPVVHQGRMLRGGGEAFLSLDAAKALRLHVGDEMPISFWKATPSDGDVDPTEVVEPTGRVRVRVVGIGVLSDEVLPDALYPRERVLVSPDVTAPFDCTPAQPPPDDTLTLEQLVAMFFPEGCARDPRYFSLRVAGGDRGVPRALSAISQRLDDENTRLPKVLREMDFGYSVIPTVTAQERTRVQRSLGPTVTALQLFGLVALLSTLTVAGLSALRSSRRVERQIRVWFELGMTRRQRMAAAGLPLGLAATLGLAGALVVAWAGSAIGPVASARALEPHAGRGIPLPVMGVVVAAAAVVLAVEIAVASFLASRERVPPAMAKTSRTSELAAKARHVPLTLGVRAALPNATGSGAGAGALLLGAVAVVTAVVGSVVFSSNLSGLVGTPARFGWPFDGGAIVGFGYGGADAGAIAQSLARPEVKRWGVAALPGEVTIKGSALPAVADWRGFDRFPLPLVAGKYPKGDDEIGLGVRSAHRLKLSVGDRVNVSTTYGERRARVAGLVVLPPVGPFSAERAGLGQGAFLPSRFLDPIVAQAERDRGLPPRTLADTLGTFVAIDLRPGVDAGRFVKALQGEARSWDVNGNTFLYANAVRPPEIADVATMRSAPTLLAVLLALTMSLGLALAIALAARGRWRELAILRALGCNGRQLRSSVRWHALTVVMVGLAGGVLIGMSVGSTTWRVFSEALGVGPSVRLPLTWIVFVVGAAIVIGLVSGEVPGRLAVRRASAAALREQ